MQNCHCNTGGKLQRWVSWFDKKLASNTAKKYLICNMTLEFLISWFVQIMMRTLIRLDYLCKNIVEDLSLN